MSRANSTFIYLWLEMMLTDYENKVDSWEYVSEFIPSTLVNRFERMGIVHVETNNIHHPMRTELTCLIGPEPFDWSNNFAINLWHHLWEASEYWPEGKSNSPETIKTIDNTYGAIARKVYYGSPELMCD